MSELLKRTALEIRRGRREGRVPTAPMVRVQQKARGRTTGTGGSSGLPCAMVLTVSFVLFPVTIAWLPPSPVRRESVFTTLAPASERQDHTTSPSAQTPFVRAIIALGDVRPSHPIPNVRDDREPPLYGERDKRNEATDLGVRSIAADRDRLARRANYADEACTFASRHHSSFRGATKSRARNPFHHRACGRRETEEFVGWAKAHRAVPTVPPRVVV